jgi:aspartyl-tRNA(Asn)/glutamyl-tRNA(Gln) amidotransferase subunit A
MTMTVWWKGYTLWSYLHALNTSTTTAHDVLQDYAQRARANDKNAFITICDGENQKTQHSKRETKTTMLRWAPLAIKDNILVEGIRTTCASQMLKDYTAPYTASCMQRLLDAWATLVWKTNLDEFAMGSSNETSAFWPVWHPLDNEYVPGGSSWGSAVAVAIDLSIAALGTDTWGSIRLPASLCGVVWYKPTYWMISRYGVIAMASSLDQVWTFTKNVDDARILLNIMEWYDTYDATTHEYKGKTNEQMDPTTKISHDRWQEMAENDIATLRIALPRQFFGEWLDEDVRASVMDLVEWLRKQWATIDIVDVPIIEYGVPVYYILMPAEVTTNLARFDGVRFGINPDVSGIQNDWWPMSLQEFYKAVRTQWFGKEVQRRILIGNYVLSSWYYDAYYRKAQAVRHSLCNEFTRIFKRYDVVIWPTSPTVARRRWEKAKDPLSMYMMDIYTVLANLAGLPAISLPIKSIERSWKKRPVWAQIMAWRFNDDRLLALSSFIERAYS